MARFSIRSTSALLCSTSSGASQGIKYADCMRKHGVPNFPDPSFGPGGRAISFNVRAGAFGSQSAALNLANKHARTSGRRSRWEA